MFIKRTKKGSFGPGHGLASSVLYSPPIIAPQGNQRRRVHSKKILAKIRTREHNVWFQWPNSMG